MMWWLPWNRIRLRGGSIAQRATPAVCHSAGQVRDVQRGSAAPRSFLQQQAQLKGRDGVVLDAVMDSGVMQEFCCGAWPKLARDLCGWRFCWINRRGGESRWSGLLRLSDCI